MDGPRDRHGQNYIPPRLVGDDEQVSIAVVYKI